MNYFGIILIFSGILWLLKISLKNKPITIFGLTDRNISIYFNNTGKFSVSTVKGRFVEIGNGFKLNIIQNFKNSNPLITKKLKFGIRTFIKNHFGSEFIKFRINEPGSYKIELEKIDKLIVKEPRFGTKRVKDRIETSEIELAIIKFYPFWHRLISIMSISFGIILILIDKN